MAPPDDHPCSWRDEAERLAAESAQRAAEIEELKQKLAALERRVLGPKSEKMPAMSGEVAKKRPPDPELAKQRRRDAAAAKAKLETTVLDVPVPDADRVCTSCGNGDLKPVGDGKPSVRYEFVQAFFRRKVVRRETLACTCGDYIVTAPAPDRFDERSPYEPSFIAYLVVSKCEDGLPFYRLAKMLSRTGIPVVRSTLNDLFHRAAERLAPLANRIVERIRGSEIVFADETSIKMLEGDTRAFVWTFLGDDLIAFVFSPSRSGQTPIDVLGDSTGELMVDMYTGYNQVTTPGRRRRAGCLAHARRKVFEAKAEPCAMEALDLVRDVYVVEHDARAEGVEGTEKHLEMRRERSRPLVARFLWWARAQRRVHPPKSPLGKAAGYIVRNRKALTRFLYVAALPPDNNRSEAALRRVALGRKNYLFVGNEDSGKNTAGLFSLVASCVHNRIDPVAYLTDVLVRIDTHPNHKVDELLPDRWRPPDPAPSD
ncbi:MAG: IS66 family transposase [Chloroflexota bacterium]|nr:IS66 family transposase [Chloroflexota bacterium]